MLSHTKSKILQELKKFDENATIEFSEHCDFTSTLAFKLAKKEKRNPTFIAEEIAAQISKNLADDVEVKALNSYLNFYLTNKFYSENLPKIPDFKFNKKDEKIILEHTSVNPSGPIHIGRIRNAIIGDCIGRTLKFCNYETEIHYYVNDMGKQIAIIALARQKNLKKELADLSDFIKNFVRNDYEILPYYIAGNEYYETDAEFKNQVDEIIRKAESGDKDAINLMKETAKFCLDGQRQALENLDIKFDKFDYESEFVENGKVNEVISHLCPDRKDNEPAEICPEEYGIKREKGKIIIARSNGTSVYLARDIAYHLYKINLINKFGSGKILNVLGEDHKQEFLELKTILEKKFNVTNISISAIFFSFVNFGGKKFSTRKGNIITIDELTNDAIEKAKNIMLEKNFATEGYKDIGTGAVKYAILKIDPQKQINFKLEDALNFEGETACYIQYSYARICRLIEKSNISEKGIKNFGISYQNVDDEELNLARNLIKFYDIAEKAGNEFRPNLLASYIYNLATLFSKFYDKCPVLNAEEDVKKRRLLLVVLVKFVLKNGLNLLGIKVIERM